MTEEPTSESKTIDVTITKKRSSLLKYLAFFLFVSLLALLVWNILLKDYLDYKTVSERPKIIKNIDDNEVAVINKSENILSSEAPEIVEKKPVIDLPAEQFHHDNKTEERLRELEAQNKSLVFYIAARELKEKIFNPDEFIMQLEFVADVSIGEADIEGRIDLLKQASENGLPTKESLISLLKKISKTIDEKQEKSFVGSLKNSFNGLVKVTKIKGDIQGEDYKAIIKRAEIAIEKGEYGLASLEAEKLGADANELVKKINNLQRVIEITDSLIEYSKSGFVNKDEIKTGEGENL
ncbi:MAG: hypothetical protein ABL857_09095 [Rickettsiales bacterium]